MSWRTTNRYEVLTGALLALLLLSCAAGPVPAQPSPAQPLPADSTEAETPPEEPLEPSEPMTEPEAAIEEDEEDDDAWLDDPSEWQLSTQDDPTRTAPGALTRFLSSRNYRSIRALREVMTEALWERYERNSVPFNGKQRTRLAAFDFNEKALRRSSSGDRPIVTGSVHTLWAIQGEVVELRRESVRLVQGEDGLWRVGRLTTQESETLKLRESVEGVTALRKVLRAWRHRDLESARAHLSPSFIDRFKGREDELEAIFVGDRSLRHAAFQIVEMEPEQERTVVVKVLLYLAPPGRPAPLDGEERTLHLIRVGQRWYVDGWK